MVGGTEPSSVLTSWTGTLLRALDERGVDVATMLADIGLDDDLRSDPERRIPLSASTGLWEAAVAATGDDAFGIAASRHVRSGTFHGLGQAFMTSPTLRAALERAARFSRVTADMAVGSARLEGGEFVFVSGWREGVARPADAAVDAAMAAIVRAARAMLGRHLAPTRVELTRPAPADRAPFEAFFRCPVHYESSENLLAFTALTSSNPFQAATTGSPRSAIRPLPPTLPASSRRVSPIRSGKSSSTPSPPASPTWPRWPPSWR